MRTTEYSPMRKLAVIVAFISPVLATPAFAEEVETLVVIGSILSKKDVLPGSAFVVTAQDMERIKPISVADLLQQVPGIQVVSEDLFGFKVNISVRGLTPRRSARTLLLEDGMPIQPAPYSEPSAHYVPSFERIDRIEVLKGSGEIAYGPQSLGGMINFITKPVPDQVESQVDLAVGTPNFQSAYLMLGAGNEQGGARLDVTQKQSDGTRDGHETHYLDVALKGVIQLGAQRTLTARFTHFIEDTILTEAGLDTARFSNNPYANPFSNDHFDLNRSALQIIYDTQIGKSVKLRTQAYAAETFRASYRQTDTSTDTMTANPATGCEGSARTNYERFAPLCGNKMRPRQFSFSGIESILTVSSTVLGHDVTTMLGGRVHHEDADRRRYNGLVPDARETSTGTLLRDWNLITTDAVSAHALSTLKLGRLAVSVGLRNEDIETTNTSVIANFVTRNLSATSHQSITLPGFGMTWQAREGVEIFGGVHKGFAPPRPDRDVDPLAPTSQVRPEKSTNFELGLRAQTSSASQVELTGFWVDFQELIVAGPLLGLPSGILINAGKASHAGGELFVRHQWFSEETHSWKPWVSLSATYLAKAEFGSSVGEGARNVRGNRIPYAPKWLGDLAFGVTTPNGISATLGLHYVGEQFADANNTVIPSADGTLGLIPDYEIARFGLTYQPPNAKWELFASVHNLFDHAYITTRTDGVFAGPPRQTLFGLRRRF